MNNTPFNAGANELKRFLAQQLVAKSQRKALNQASVWAERYRVMTKTFPGPWTFKHHPWLKQIHDDVSEVIVSQKAAQMGLSEVAINRTFFRLDVRGEDVLYLLPNSKPDASDFSTGRFEPALQASEHIMKMFSDTKNIGMKKAGTAILYIRGSRSDSQLKSIPTGNVVYDEYDEMPEGVRALAQERMSGQANRSEFLLSTPTIPDKFINAEFLASDQKSFFFRCPRCGQLERLTTEDNLVIVGDKWNDPRVSESHLICKNTKLVLPHETKVEWLSTGIWVPAEGNTNISGYHINQLYSMVAHPSKFATSKLRGDVHPAYAQEFYKSKEGLPYIEKGAQVTDEELEFATRDYNQVTMWQGGFTVMGVDVGTRLHYEIIDVKFENIHNVVDINMSATTRVLRAGSVADFSELDNLMAAYHIAHCVIDANPERRKAQEFCERYQGRASMCFYISGLSSSNPINIQPEYNAVKVDRTSWLDLTLARFRGGTKIIPRDIGDEYKTHMKALVRMYVIADNGDISSKYINARNADHLAHAANYAEIAIRVATSVGTVQHT